MDDADWLLLKAIAEGSTSALEQLYQRHGLQLLNFLLQQTGDRLCAEEAIQATMMTIWKNAAQFRGESKVSTWMFSIARQQALKAQRSEHSHLSLHENTPSITDETTDPLLVSAMQAALSRLSAVDQEALELVYYRGLTLVEAAHHLNIPVNTLKSRLHRAREHLRKLLAREGFNHASGI